MGKNAKTRNSSDPAHRAHLPQPSHPPHPPNPPDPPHPPDPAHPPIFSEAWLKRVQERVNADPELRVIGDWFTTAFSLTSGDTRCILRFERGQLTEIFHTPRLDVRCAFGFRTSPDIWARFFAKNPEPLYHDFFAMLMRVPGFVLEGDTLVAMQHARALHRAMNLMRAVGAEED